jgi:predicted dehydrogenase
MNFNITQSSITIVLIGAGNRGRGVFGRYALDNPHKAQYVAVVEPDDKKEMLLRLNIIYPNLENLKLRMNCLKKKTESLMPL